MTIQPKYGHLVIVSRSGADGKAFPMHHARVTIGRKETCDIRMQRPQVSKEHCIIRAVSNEIVLTNLSENGTAVNAKALGVNQQQVLRPGDLVTIVGRSLRYEGPSSNIAAQQQQQPIYEASRQVNALATVRKLDRRQHTHPLGNSERITRKLRLWDEHYSDLRAESPPPGLLDDDPFGGADAASTSLFSRMAARVERGMSKEIGNNSGNIMASPLKRTMSSGGRMSRKGFMDMLDGTGSIDSTNIDNNNNNNDDDDEEVLTEPEPEPEPEAVIASEANGVTALPTPLSELKSRTVRFGPPLSPEVFDTQAPPSTPLRRGTPMPIKRISSILRPNQPGFMDSIPETAESPTSYRKSAFDIESPVTSRIRSRRRRSLRTASKERRATMEPLALKIAPSSSSSSSSPQLLVRTKPQPDSFSDLARKRKERRRTAPVVPDFSISASAPSIAEIAAALGEDIPVYNPPAKKEVVEQPSNQTKEEDDEFGALPLPASALEPLLGSQAPIGLADAFHMTQQRSSSGQVENEDDDEEERRLPASSSEALLEEQAALQARFSGAKVDISERLGQLSVDSMSRRRRRQTTTVFEGLGESLGELADTSAADDTDSVIAHRQRLRRMQERKRRRQTVAELNRRRSSWRGWTGGGSLLTQSPPLSATDHVGGMASSDIEAEFGERQPAKPFGSSASTFTSLKMPSKEKENEKRKTGTMVYPPKPIPIDEGWEIVDPQQPDRTPAPVEAKPTAVAKGSKETQRMQTPPPAPSPSSSPSPSQPQLQKDAAAALPARPKQAAEKRLDKATAITTTTATPATPGRSSGRKRRQTSENHDMKATPRKKRQQEPSATPPVTRSAKRARRSIK
ncbi:antigen identified by monoclonal antibody Ki-67 [Coemansia sp. RSA 1843]|nr:antigen identified by monoclonal antibody Ki-67 [Coemansia sp. RSA 1843]